MSDVPENPTPRRFSLIEAIALATILLIAIAVCIPWMISARRQACMAAAAATLKACFAAEVQFQAGCYIDRDTDMVGEYGHIGHLTGGLATHKVKAGAVALLTGPISDAPPQAIVKTSVGYGFTAWVPDAVKPDDMPLGPPLIEGTLPPAELPIGIGLATANDAEKWWLIAAVPLTSRMGDRVLLIREDGIVRSPAAAATDLPWTEDGTATATAMAAGLDHALSRPGNLASALTASYAPDPPR